MNIIEQMLSKYEINTENELVNALKEIFQEIALLGLYRGSFFGSPYKTVLVDENR